MAKKKTRGAKAKSAPKASKETPAKGAKQAAAKDVSKKAQPKKAPSEAASSKLGRIARLKEFFDQSKVEIKKVVWPTRKETIATSVAVLILVLVMSIFLGIVDLGLAKAIKAILS
ncbi:MAG: preprotein translocase subunit SecE [Thermodesulfobacteriota bacterium]|nr:preprotein translocase subunit SecE [Thermodesulfobacteriota bacterium]